MAQQGWAGTSVSTGRTVHDPLLARILHERAITTLFQPIVELESRRIVGMEALTRGPAGTALESPDALFRAATHAGVLVELDMMCVAVALETARDATTPIPPLVFVNAEPAALSDDLSPDLLAAVRSELGFRMVLEFTERALSSRPAALLRVAGLAHAHGNAIALDDVGADPLSLAFLPLVEPEVVKLDMHLVRHPHDPRTLATAAAVCGFAERTGATVIAEGVETEQDVASAVALGARWGQGWLFGRPAPVGALAGRPIDRTARLRPPQRGLHLPAGTPFGSVAARNPVRRAGSRMLDAIVEQVLGAAAASGPHGVVLCAPNGPGRPGGWLRPLAEVAGRVAYVGVLTAKSVPGHPGTPDIDAGILDGGDAIVGESTLAVLGPHTAVALCLRPCPDGDPDAADFVLTQDRDLVQAVSRMIVRRLPY